MALDACNDAIATALGRDLTDREKGAVARKATELKRKIDLAGGDPMAINAVLGDFGKDIATRQAIARRTAALDYTALMKQNARRAAEPVSQTIPAEYAKGLFVQSQKDYFGAKASLGTAVGKESGARVSALEADLMKAGLHEYAFKSGDDENIWMARAAMNDPKSDTASLSTQYGKNAVAVADIFRRHQDALVADKNLAGSWIGKTPDYVTTQTHEPFLLARGANKDFRFGSPEAFAEWSSNLGKMDWNKSFGGDLADATDAEKTDRLRSIWNQFVSGKHLAWSDNGGPASIAARGTREREIAFQTPKDAYDYWNKYGKNGSLAESVYHEMERGGRDVAIMREWGPNALANIKKFFDQYEKSMSESNDVQGSAALSKARQQVDRYLPTLTDALGNPDSNTAAHYMGMVRQTLNMAKIGASLPSHLGDLILRASYVQRMGSKSTADFLGGLVNGVKDVIAQHPDADKQTLAAEFGIRLKHATSPMGMEFHEVAGTGKLAKYTQLVMKATGDSFLDNGLRTGSLAADGFRHWTMRDREFGALPDGTQQLMQQFGMGQKEWDIIRRSEPLDLESGQKILAPSQIRKMDGSEFQSVANGNSDAVLRRARDQVADRYRNMLGEMADTVVSTPNRNMRAIINAPMLNAKPWQQELYRGFFGLKGFVSNYMRNHLGGIALGQDADPANVGWGKAMARTLSGQNGGSAFKMLVTLMAGGIGMGYIKDAIRDIADGKTPEDPTDWSGDKGPMYSPGANALTRAMTFQTLGLLSDYVLGQGRPNATAWDKLGGLAGPEISSIGDLADDVTKGAGHLGKWAADRNYSDEDFANDFSKDAAYAGKDLYGDIPGNNLLWTKWATDYALLDNWMEIMNPGYKQRLQQKAAKTGQQYLMLPK